MNCSDMDNGKESEMNPDDDETDDDIIMQDPLSIVAVNYDEDANKEDCGKNDRVILQDYGEDGGDPTDGLVYDPEVLGYDAGSTHMANPFNAYHPFRTSLPTEILEKPPYSFNSLIAMAIENSEHKWVTVQEVCQFIADRFPYYDLEDESWKNHIRYTLTTQKCFVSSSSNPFEGGLWPGSCGPFWTIDKDYKARSRQGQRWGRSGLLDFDSYGESTYSQENSRLRKPPYSYTTLIAMAIEASEGKMATLSDIYKYISSKFPYYDLGLKLWQNSIRHFLSVTKYFVKVPKENAGRGHYWTIGVPPSEKNNEVFQCEMIPNLREVVDDEMSDNSEDTFNKSDMEPEVIVVEPEVTISPQEDDLPPLPPPPLPRIPPDSLAEDHPRAFIIKAPNTPINAIVLKEALNKTLFLKQNLGKLPFVMQIQSRSSVGNDDSTEVPIVIPGYPSLKCQAATFLRIAPKPSGNILSTPIAPSEPPEIKIDYKKPPFAFTTLISMAIENSPSGMATLGEIYEFISTRFPYFGMDNKGWQNTVRHFLSVTNYFVKIPRDGMKGNYWTIEKSKKKPKGGHKTKRGPTYKKGYGRARAKKLNKNDFNCSLCTFTTDNNVDANDHMLSIHGIFQDTSRLINKNKDNKSNSKTQEDDSESTESCKEFPDSPSSQNGDSEDKSLDDKSVDKCQCHPTPNLSCKVCAIEHDDIARSHLVTSNNKNAALTC